MCSCCVQLTGLEVVSLVSVHSYQLTVPCKCKFLMESFIVLNCLFIVPIVASSLSSDEPVTVSSSTSNMGETIISYMHSINN